MRKFIFLILVAACDGEYEVSSQDACVTYQTDAAPGLLYSLCDPNLTEVGREKILAGIGCNCVQVVCNPCEPSTEVCGTCN